MTDVIDEQAVPAVQRQGFAEAPPASTAPDLHRFEFSGSGGEYFRIWIVNLALTIVTLGIYSAWAKVRRERYFHGHTALAGSTFGYHGDPRAILKGRIVAAIIFVAYGMVSSVFPAWAGLAGLVLVGLLPYLRVKSMAFRLRMTSWRGLRFHFHENYGAAYRALLGWSILAFLTLGLLLPAALRARARFIVSHSQYGTTRFDFKSRLTPYVIACLIIGIGLVLTVAAIAAITFSTMAMAEAGNNEPGSMPWQLLLLPVPFIALIAGSGFVVAMLTNAMVNGASIGPHKLHANLHPGRMAWLMLTNLLAIVCTLGLFAPWARVRLVRYQLERLSLETNGSLNDFVAAQAGRTGATGEAIGEVFDMDFGL